MKDGKWRNREQNMEYMMIQIPFENFSFEEMKKADAKKFFEWYVNQSTTRVEYLKWFINNEGVELNLDYSVDSLIPLWKWYEGKIVMTEKSQEEWEAEKAQFPEWVRPYISREEISNDTLKIMLDVAYYFAEVVIRNNGGKIKWGYFTKPKSRMSVNEPTLLGFMYDKDLNPRLIVKICTEKSATEKNEKMLYETYNTWMKYI